TGKRPLDFGIGQLTISSRFTSSSSGNRVQDPFSRAGNGKRERGTRAAGVRLGPKTPLMSLDNRAADKQANTHAAALGRVESIEHRVEALRRKAHACVADGQTHPVA